MEEEQEPQEEEGDPIFALLHGPTRAICSAKMFRLPLRYTFPPMYLELNSKVKRDFNVLCFLRCMNASRCENILITSPPNFPGIKSSARTAADRSLGTTTVRLRCAAWASYLYEK